MKNNLTMEVLMKVAQLLLFIVPKQDHLKHMFNFTATVSAWMERFSILMIRKIAKF